MARKESSPENGSPHPRSFGARNSATASTKRCWKKAPNVALPPSSNRERTPRWTRAVSTSSRSSRPGLFWLTATTSAPLRRKTSRRSSGTSGPQKISALLSLSSAAFSGRRSAVSKTTGRGETPEAPLTVRAGSSASTVPIPTRTASCSRRRTWATRRERSFVIQRLCPSARASMPSQEQAPLAVIQGRPASSTRKKPRLISRQASSNTPSTQ